MTVSGEPKKPFKTKEEIARLKPVSFKTKAERATLHGEGEKIVSDQYLIWSNEHGAWWGPGRAGYVRRIENAGCYTHNQALAICTEAMPGRSGDEPLQEIPVRLEDVSAMLHFFAGTYPGHDPEPEER